LWEAPQGLPQNPTFVPAPDRIAVAESAGQTGPTTPERDGGEVVLLGKEGDGARLAQGCAQAKGG